MNLADVEQAASNALPGALSTLARAIASEPVARRISPIVLTGFVRFAEFLSGGVIGAAMYAIFIYPSHGFTWSYAAAIPLLAGATVLASQVLGTYSIAAFRTPAYQLARLVIAWTLVFLSAFAIWLLVELEPMLSLLFAISWFAAGLSGLLIGRFGLSMLVRRWAHEGRLTRRVVIVGGGREGESLLHALEGGTDLDLRICGIFDDRVGERSPPIVAGVPKLGTVDDLVQFTRLTRVDLVLVSLPLNAEERVLQMVRKLWVLPVDIRLAAHISRLRFRPRAYSYIGHVPVLDISDKPIADWNMVMKAMFDRVAGLLILVALAPVMAATAIAIKLDSQGPVFFRQRRLGFNNKVIEVLKFRSLYHEYADPNGRLLVTKGDLRVTPVGRFIRKTSIDELPQLLNVLRGDLSLVGPRPHAIEAPTANKLWEEVVGGYFARHRVKPGLTGWAQINGWRGEINAPEKLQRRVEHDLYYIENWSLLFDIFILLRTPLALTKFANAY
jgi:Undecaprenyl-phosphate glucose phosphotransferase